jgi:fatty acid desaturase
MILLYDFLAGWLCWYSGGMQSINSFFAVAILLGVAQIQAGWLQHDFGHLAVFKSMKLNYIGHLITIVLLKGASSLWWKTRHNRHHAKTNVIGLDPDIANDPLFLVGQKMLEARRGWRYTPYQHRYWWVFGPPLVTTLLFFYQNIKFVLPRKLRAEKILTIAFFTIYISYFWYFSSFWKMFGLYWTFRLIESQWFTWVTSMSHIPLHIEDEPEGKTEDWITHTARTTQNQEGGWFNNWFTGHLNYQVEHHLFPSMPRHNLPKVHSRVLDLYKYLF